jgi:glycolate oxidase FAD binding subunit
MSHQTPTAPDPVTPSTPHDVADVLRVASERRQSVLIRGAGTKLDWGRPAGPIDVVLDMRRLNRVLSHPHGDLTATIEAGASLSDVNEALGRYGQCLPLDPPFAERATIGGILATNDSGPLRHRYGAPRDLVIGIQLATTDGVLSKAGGQVVKNVAGYDLSKLVTGSFGSLAAIVSATFKLSPLPKASKTIRMTAADSDSLGHVVRAVMASQLEPIAFEINVEKVAQAFKPAILLRFASLPAVVDAQIAQATAALKDHTTALEVLDDDAERATWHAHATQLWDEPGAIVRASWLPANITSGLRELERMDADLKACATGAGGATRAGGIAIIGRAAIGAGLIRIDADTASQASIVEQLRASRLFGNIVIVRGSAALKALVDVWGSQGDRAPLLASLKRAFDPNGVLNAGRGPL